MAFVDEIEFTAVAGRGGNGVVRWRREKSKPWGGPGGGNGGNGGDVFIEAVRDLGYLETYRHTKAFRAKDGGAGGGLGMHGANGDDTTVYVPVGSLVTNRETGEIFDFTSIGQRILVLKGGRGGVGNEAFKSSRNVAPEQSTPGAPGETGDFHIELRLIADLGFVGLPSVGKSTLLNALTNARSKVAAYHFTTLDPHLGAFNDFILADIPGLIEGASDGKGLGFKFLRHIKRTRVIAHVIALDSEHPEEDYKTIRAELEAYDPEFKNRQEILVFTKSDMVDVARVEEVVRAVKKLAPKSEHFVLSAYDDVTIKALADGLTKLLRTS